MLVALGKCWHKTLAFITYPQKYDVSIDFLQGLGCYWKQRAAVAKYIFMNIYAAIYLKTLSFSGCQLWQHWLYPTQIAPMCSSIFYCVLSPFVFLVQSFFNCNSEIDIYFTHWHTCPSLHTLSGACDVRRHHGETPGGVQHGGAAGESGGEDSLPGGGAAGVWAHELPHAGDETLPPWAQPGIEGEGTAMMAEEVRRWRWW